MYENMSYRQARQDTDINMAVLIPLSPPGHKCVSCKYFHLIRYHKKKKKNITMSNFRI